MYSKSLLAVPLVSALLIFRTGLATPNPCPAPAPATPPTCAAQDHRRETPIAPPPYAEAAAKAFLQVKKCLEQYRPICKPAEPAPRCTPAPAMPPVPDLDVPAPEPVPQPAPADSTTHTLTINNGKCVVQRTYVKENGSWQNYEDVQKFDVFFRDCPRSAWRLYGTYVSPRDAEQAASAVRARGALASVRQHCG
jgi:hypothetical protein